MNGRRLKIKVFVEFLRLLVNRMNQYSTSANDVSRSRNADERIFEQRLSQACSLFPLVDRKPGEKNHRHRMTSQAF